MEMHCGPIHRLPEDLRLTGVIALDTETGFYTFYRATTDRVQGIKQNLLNAGAEEKKIIIFEGFKQRLIATVKPLNDEIRAKNKALENHLPSSPGELPFSPAT